MLYECSFSLGTDLQTMHAPCYNWLISLPIYMGIRMGAARHATTTTASCKGGWPSTTEPTLRGNTACDQMCHNMINGMHAWLVRVDALWVLPNIDV